MIRRTSKIAVVIAASAFALINTTYAIEIAEALLIELDAEDASADTGIWVNTGSEGGNFIAQGNPLVEQADGDLGTGGARGLNFNSTGTLDVYVSDFDAPAGIIGVDPTAHNLTQLDLGMEHCSAANECAGAHASVDAAAATF